MTRLTRHIAALRIARNIAIFFLMLGIVLAAWKGFKYMAIGVVLWILFSWAEPNYDDDIGDK